MPTPAATEAEVSSREPTKHPAPVAPPVGDAVSPMRTGVWVLESLESCFEFYQRLCSASLPPYQCPTAVDGQSCSIPDHWEWCGKRISSTVFQVYFCN